MDAISKRKKKKERKKKRLRKIIAKGKERKKQSKEEKKKRNLIVKERKNERKKERFLSVYLFGFMAYVGFCRLFNAKSILIQIISSISNNSFQHEYTVELSKTFLFPAIQFSQTILIQTIPFCISVVFVHSQLNVKTILFQVIQFYISTQFSSIWPIDRTLSSATYPGLSGSESDDNEGVLCIPQFLYYWNLTISVISGTLVKGCLSFCRGAVGVFYSPSRLGKERKSSERKIGCKKKKAKKQNKKKQKPNKENKKKESKE